MQGVKKNPVCIVICLCSALLACYGENPETADRRRPPGLQRRHDPVDLLAALPAAKGFDRALMLERLWLTKEAIYAWNEEAKTHPELAVRARLHIERLQNLPDPVRQWSTSDVDDAWRRRDEAALTKIARAFPEDTARSFEKCDLRDRERARLFARALAAAGEHYPQAVVDAMDRSAGHRALDDGLAAFRQGEYEDAARLLEKAGNPLFLTARYYVAVLKQSLSALDAIISQVKPEYRELSSRVHIYRASLLEFNDRYLQAHADYTQALNLAAGEPTSTASALGRESWNFAAIGDPAQAFRDAHHALSLLPRVADMNARNHACGGAANAAAQLGHPDVALLYQNAAVENMQRAVAAAPPRNAPDAKIELSIALRLRAEFLVQLGQDVPAEDDLQLAADLAEAAAKIEQRDLLRMRRLDVEGQALLLKHQPSEAVTAFSEAIELAKHQDSTYRAILHFKRGEARRSAGDAHSDDDIAVAMKILRNEVRGALAKDPHTASEPLWTPYFLRFREQHHELIESRIAAQDFEGALVYAELARAFEPMQILLQADSLPQGFRFIETKDDLQHARASLPEDTVILQFLVLPEGTYTWIVTREGIQPFRQRATEADIQRWVNEVKEAVDAGQDDPFTRATRAAYAALFRDPLQAAGATKTRIVIVPDGPMQGLPFNALGSADEGYLIERASITTAGSMSLYLYALAHDRELSRDRHPTAFLIGDPAFEGFDRLPHAQKEVELLSRQYAPDAETLTDTAATVERFLADAKRATVVHFAGHALASPQTPWQSRLLFASHGGESGELTAQKLMQKLPKLARTRLVVLGACSTAGGSSLGPQGLAPLVRPFIAARVPAVVGSLWNVGDASTQPLMVFLHCRYRHGDDVAVALQNAQLEELRNNHPARAWAAFQVAGFAASPYPRSLAMEDTNSEHVCTENSLLRPHGLHSQPERDRSHGPAAQQQSLPHVRRRSHAAPHAPALRARRKLQW
jgi:CHAT domain-containing protein